MSAIAGIYHSNKEPVSIEHSRGIMKALQKYPADDVQAWCKQNIFLGCHAQWITPESVGEKLPYHDYESKLTITADAIIDNREELFEKLQVERGYQKQMTDSELILRAYQKWGEASPKYLVGDFAYMIWDEREQKLFGARDFSGSRTLYYYHDGQRFAFCTTIMPLFSLPYLEKQLNEEWLAEFLAIPDMIDTVDVFSTAYQNIHQVPPCHSISVKLGRISFLKYSKIVPEKKLKLKSNEEYVEAFREVFQNAVNVRLRTHHKIGAELSGGLDSGSVVSFAAKTLRNENKRLHTFSYVPMDNFSEWMPKHRVANERPFIQSTVNYVGNITDHYSNFEGKSSLSEIDDWLETLEMPYKFFENSFWLKGIYEEASNEKIGVLLNGARGNLSISWGPALDFHALLLKRLNLIHFYHEVNQYCKNIDVPKSRVLSAVKRRIIPFAGSYPFSGSYNRLTMLINPEFAKHTGVFEKVQHHGIHITENTSVNPYEGRKRHFDDVVFWDKNGAKATKMSLSHSLWERDATNDLRVIRFCLSIPESQFVQNGLDRALIRRSMEHFLPDNVRLNQRVRGFQAGEVVHRMSSSWRSFIEELKGLVEDSEVSWIFNVTAIKNAFSKVQEVPQSDYVLNPDFTILMRSLIVYRFIKNLTERGQP